MQRKDPMAQINLDHLEPQGSSFKSFATNFGVKWNDLYTKIDKKLERAWAAYIARPDVAPYVDEYSYVERFREDVLSDLDELATIIGDEVEINFSGKTIKLNLRTIGSPLHTRMLDYFVKKSAPLPEKHGLTVDTALDLYEQYGDFIRIYDSPHDVLAKDVDILMTPRKEKGKLDYLPEFYEDSPFAALVPLETPQKDREGRTIAPIVRYDMRVCYRGLEIDDLGRVSDQVADIIYIMIERILGFHVFSQIRGSYQLNLFAGAFDNRCKREGAVKFVHENYRDTEPPYAKHEEIYFLDLKTEEKLSSYKELSRPVVVNLLDLQTFMFGILNYDKRANRPHLLSTIYRYKLKDNLKATLTVAEIEESIKNAAIADEERKKPKYTAMNMSLINLAMTGASMRGEKLDSLVSDTTASVLKDEPKKESSSGHSAIYNAAMAAKKKAEEPSEQDIILQNAPKIFAAPLVRFDIVEGETKLLPLVDEYYFDDANTPHMDRLFKFGVNAGFVFFALDDLKAQNKSVQDILYQVSSYIMKNAGSARAEIMGTAIGTTFVYLDLIIWDTAEVFEILEKMAREPMFLGIKVRFHSFYLDSPVKDLSPSAEELVELSAAAPAQVAAPAAPAAAAAPAARPAAAAQAAVQRPAAKAAPATAPRVAAPAGAPVARPVAAPSAAANAHPAAGAAVARSAITAAQRPAVAGAAPAGVVVARPAAAVARPAAPAAQAAARPAAAAPTAVRQAAAAAPAAARTEAAPAAARQAMATAPRVAAPAGAAGAPRVVATPKA